jgi:hypothetical protein
MLKKDKGLECFKKADLYDMEDAAEDVEFTLQGLVPLVRQQDWKVDWEAEVLGWE